MSEDEAGWQSGLWAAADLVTPMAVRVAATLRLADHIAGGTRTPAALAAATGADEQALSRLLAHLVAAGVFSRAEDGDLSLLSLGEQLQDDHPQGVRRWIDLDGALGHADMSLVHMLHTVRTGEAAFPQQFGRSFWTDLSADDARAASFDALMGGRLEADAPVLATAYPWGSLGHVIDVGGGNGSLLIAILRAHDCLRGTVLELPGPAARAERAIAAAGLSDRADARAGSFFDPLAVGAGGYVLSGVLHDWDDEHAVRILARCAEAAGDTGKVIVLEEAMELDEGGTSNTEGDLRMLCYVRGQDRTLDQLGSLARAAGLEVGAVVPGHPRTLIELRR